MGSQMAKAVKRLKHSKNAFQLGMREGREGRKAGSKVPPAIRRAKRRKK
jgi:hypothetical protein